MTSDKQSNQSYIELKNDGWTVMTEDVDIDIDGNKLPIDGHCSIMCGNLVIKPNKQDDIDQQVNQFFKQLAAEQKPLPSDMAKVLHNNFWDL